MNLGLLPQMHMVLQLCSDIPSAHQKLAESIDREIPVEVIDDLTCQPIVRYVLLAKFIVFEVCQFKYFLKDVKREMRFLVNHLSNYLNNLTLKHLVIIDK